MSNITENTRRFIENSGVDYYTYFIKTWIPFNAWYKQKWTGLHSDREAINEIKDTTNEVRSAIINFIEGDGDHSETFRSYLSSLHYQLLENTIENRENRITFENVVLGKNRIKLIEETNRGIKYNLKRTDARIGIQSISVEVLSSSGTPKCQKIEQTEYNIEVLKEDRELNKLTDPQKELVIKYYKELIPYQSLNLIQSRPNDNSDGTPENYKIIGSFKFIDNSEKIAQGLIEIIYALRCVLFHGELNPNEANNEVYKNLYNILYAIVKKLR